MKEQLNIRVGLLRAVKLLAFFLLLLVFGIVSLARLVKADKTEITARQLLTGAALSGSAEGGSWLRGDYTDDQNAPVLTLNGDGPIDVEVGGGYTEPGYTATDAYGRDLSDRVTAEIFGDVLLYTVTDPLGNETTTSRDITYVDTTPPEITLVGGNEYHVPAGTDFEEPGYTAIDNSDGDVTANVRVSGEVEKYRLGSYTLTYTVSDSLGNENTVTRTVWRDAAPQPETVDPQYKAIYLTFDDGPGPYTEELLDLLDQYGVKVTFFVTAQDDDYLDLITEEDARGHTVAIHSYSHDYAIYSSEDTYFEDLYAMQDIIEEKTGHSTTLVRFPGGSSNTISANYCYGIMSTLVEDLDAMGYQYFDWNVTSGDAGETEDTAQIYYNVTSEIAYNGDYEPNIVLQHDIKGFSVAAVEDIIVWGLENGYQFLPLTSSSPTVHHGTNN